MSTCDYQCESLVASRAACLNLRLGTKDTVTFWVELLESDLSAPIDLSGYANIEASGRLYTSDSLVFEIDKNGGGITVGGVNDNRLTFTITANAEGRGTWDCAGILGGNKHFLLHGDLIVSPTVTRIGT